MATNQKPDSKKTTTLRARVEETLKARVTKYRKQPKVGRSEGYVVRVAVEEFLSNHAA